jgi:hypothetical protein
VSGLHRQEGEHQGCVRKRFLTRSLPARAGVLFVVVVILMPRGHAGRARSSSMPKV